MSVAQENILFLKEIEKRLGAGGVLSAGAEADELVRHFGCVGRADLLTGEKALGAGARSRIARALGMRLKGVPLSHVLKEREFLGRKFFINSHVLTPRLETEILVEEALKVLDGHYFSKGLSPEVLDVGTGSACIAVSLTSERPDCRMTALDISKKALTVARKNIYLHGLQKKIRLLRSDLLNAFHGKEKSWDVIVSNPPYVPEGELPELSREVRQEPKLALNGGSDGTGVIRSILEKAPGFLNEKGWLLLEIGAGQSGVLREIISRNRHFKRLNFIKDMTGIDRVLIVRKR